MTPWPIAANDAPVPLPSVQVSADSQPGVESPKFTAPLVDTPQTVVAIPKEIYAEQAAASLSDVLRNTPGITFFAGEGGSAVRTGGDSFYLRGFDTSNSIFVDGVRDEGPITRDTFNIEQVDVVKGPAAENGRGGTAGYIDLESKAPKAGAFHSGTAAFGFDDTRAEDWRRATIDANQPLGGGAAVRVNLMDQRGGIPGRDQAEKNRWGAAPSLALGLGSPLSASLAYQHVQENNIPDYGLPAGAVAGLVPSGLPSLYSPGVPADNYYGFANFDRERISNDTFTGRLSAEPASGARLSDQFRYSATGRFIEATSPTTTSGSSSSAPTPPGEATLTHAIAQTRNTILSEQANAKLSLETGPVAHDLSAGIELSRERALTPAWSAVPNGAPNPAYLVDIYRPNPFPAALLNYAPHPTGSLTDTRIDTGALYAFDTAKFGRRWQATAGVRLERYALSEESVTAASPAVAATPGGAATASVPATAATAAAAAVPASAAFLSSGRDTASAKAGLLYKPAEDGSLYVSYDTSARPPGASTSSNTLSTAAANADNPLAAPQKAVNYEAGAKWSLFHQRLSASAALFRSVNKNVPATDPVTGLTDQTSDQTVDGLEIGLAGKVNDDWSLFAGYSFLHPAVSALISANAQGLTLPLLPKQSGNLWTTCRLPRGFTAGGGAQYVGATRRLQAPAGQTPATFSGQVPSYWLFNAMLAYELNRHLTLRVNASNLADKHSIASLNNNGFRANLGAPRAFVVTAEFHF